MLIPLIFIFFFWLKINWEPFSEGSNILYCTRVRKLAILVIYWICRKIQLNNVGSKYCIRCYGGALSYAFHVVCEMLCLLMLLLLLPPVCCLLLQYFAICLHKLQYSAYTSPFIVTFIVCYSLFEPILQYTWTSNIEHRPPNTEYITQGSVYLPYIENQIELYRNFAHNGMNHEFDVHSKH